VNGAQRLRTIVQEADRAPVAGREVALSASRVRGDTIEILLGEVRNSRNPYSGEPMRERLDVRRLERMPDYTSFEASVTTIAPAAYLVLPSETETMDRLAAHGIGTWVLDRGGPFDVQRFTVDSVSVSELEYQRRRQTTLFGSWTDATVELPAGTVVVPVDQPLGRIAALLLEPTSDDGLVAWSVLELDEGKRFPVLRSEKLPEGP
jgi:hypothetical protein